MKTNVVKFCLLLVFLSLVVVGCQDENYYDASNNKPSKADLFPDDVLISDDFDWSMTKTLELSVSVDDKYNGAHYYTIEVYDENPLVNTKATLLGGGVAKKDNDFVSKIVIPNSLSIVYILQIDPTGEKRVTATQVENKSLLPVSFKAVAEYSNSAIKSTVLRASTIVDIPATPSTAIDITSGSFNGNINSGNSYFIPVGKEYRGTVNPDWDKGGTLFVEGVWTIPSNVNLIYYSIVVQKGGAIKFENENLNLDIYGHLMIADGATFGKGNLNLSFIGGGPSVKQISNYGVLNVKTLNLDNDCWLVNYGDVTANEINSRNNSKAYIRNQGTITATNIKFTGSGASLVNNCQLVVNQKLTLSGTILEIGEGALISALSLETANSTINMFSNAMLVTESADFIANGARTIIYGLGSSNALFKTSTLTFGGWNVFSAYNNLAIIADKIVDKGGGNTTYAPAYFANSGASAPNIQATDCNGNGNPVEPGKVIVRKPLPVELGTYSYAFEDNWPTYGDYDMNDLVADIALVREQNTDNKLTKLTIKSRLLAVGASKRLGAAIQLDGILAENIKSVSYSNSNIIGQSFVLNSSGVEAGQTYAIVPLCDDAHKAFGVDSKSLVNTTDVKYDPVEQNIIIEFKSPVDLLTNDDLNVFIVTGGYKNTRTEIHLNSKQPTDKVNTFQLASANLKSIQQVYRSHENLVWGLCVPGSFKYPNEWVKITDVYPLFKEWAESNGASGIEWYKERK